MKNCLASALWGVALLTVQLTPAQDFPPVNPMATPRTSNNKGSTEKIQDTKVTTDAGTIKTSTDALT
jgi:hypothetical protein